MKMKIKLPPIHPGEILSEDFLKPMGISQYRLAKAIHVHPVTADTALRMSRALGTTAELWLNAQASYELEVARDAKDDEMNTIELIAVT